MCKYIFLCSMKVRINPLFIGENTTQNGKHSMRFLMLIFDYALGLIYYMLYKNDNPNFQKEEPKMTSVLMIKSVLNRLRNFITYSNRLDKGLNILISVYKLPKYLKRPCINPINTFIFYIRVLRSLSNRKVKSLFT